MMNAIKPNTDKRFPVVVDERRPFYGPVALGNGTQFMFGMFYCRDGRDGRLLVGIEGHGAYTFGSFVHWTCAADKLGLMDADAKNVADFINDQLDDLDKECRRQGRYEHDLLEAQP